jgi:hypothetical protein
VNCVAERVLDYRRQSGRSSACRLMARQGAKPVKPVLATPALSRNCDDLASRRV